MELFEKLGIRHGALLDGDNGTGVHSVVNACVKSALKKRIANRFPCPCGGGPRPGRCHNRVVNDLRQMLGRRKLKEALLELCHGARLEVRRARHALTTTGQDSVGPGLRFRPQTRLIPAGPGEAGTSPPFKVAHLLRDPLAHQNSRPSRTRR